MTPRALAAGAAALAVAGCGSSPPSPSAQLQRQATRVCTQAQARGAEIKPPVVPAQTAAFLRRGIAFLGPELAGLRALRVPPVQSGAYSTAVGSLARELTILTATARDLDRGADPVAAIRALQQRLAPVEAAAGAAWRTLGVPACVGR
jgi:hypothetical protein